VTQEQVESQLSAMFDGELPAAECELLSRRIDRDENLRARWSRYALIGAAMRSEPVATARRGFAGRVSAALNTDNGKSVQIKSVQISRVRKRTLWNTALAASMVAAVAGVSISMLRYSSPTAGSNFSGTVVRTGEPARPAASNAGSAGMQTSAALRPAAIRVVKNASNGEPLSYVTPTNAASPAVGLRTDLADFIVAHSEYSSPLMRRNLLSALVSSDDSADASAGTEIDAAPAASAAAH
jgi:sigma-E factor negative regulatory protein RseA